MNLFAGLPRIGFVFLLTMATSSLCAAQTYTVTDLGTLRGGSFSGARAINATGEITGYAYDSNNSVSDVFLYSNATMTDLGTLGGTSAIGNGINASGQVAGYSTVAAGTYRATAQFKTWIFTIVRNLVFNPRTPLDLSLSLMKNLLVGDLRNLSNNKEISDTVRKLATKMFKQKMESNAKR